MKRQEFSIKIASTGDTFIVPANKTILDILLENGIKHPHSCKQGMCEKCITTYLEGEVDHCDMVANIDHSTQLTVCTSRAKSDLLVLYIDLNLEEDEF